jgi:hypothetical protein
MPRKEKIEAVINHIQREGALDKPIKVHPKTKMLVDGFARYLAAKEMGMREVPVRYGEKPDPKPPKKRKLAKNPARKLERKPRITDDTILAVWEAEDGRCEVCKRPMDKRVARWLPRDPERIENHPDSIHLACVDCFRRQPDFLMAVIKVKGSILEKLKQRMNTPPENLEEWLGQALRDYGVVITGGKESRQYWLPRIGSFTLRAVEEQGSPFPVREVFKAKLYQEGQLNIKPQERTRGLPRPALRLS